MLKIFIFLNTHSTKLLIFFFYLVMCLWFKCEIASVIVNVVAIIAPISARFIISKEFIIQILIIYLSSRKKEISSQNTKFLF